VNEDETEELIAALRRNVAFEQQRAEEARKAADRARDDRDEAQANAAMWRERYEEARAELRRYEALADAAEAFIAAAMPPGAEPEPELDLAPLVAAVEALRKAEPDGDET
jgi:hypothetical protein